MLNKHEAFVYNTLPYGYTEDNLFENEFHGRTHEAIQNAINYVHDNGGGEVHISRGKFEICGTESTGSSTTGGINALKMYDNIRLIGESNRCSEGDDHNYDHTEFISTSKEPLASIISIFGSKTTPVKNVSIYDITFEGIAGIINDEIVYCPYAIFVKHAIGITVRNCKFRDFKSIDTNACCKYTNCANLKLDGGYFENVYSGVFIESTNNGLIGNYEIEGETCLRIESSGNIIVNNSSFKSSYCGISLLADDTITISESSFDILSGSGISDIDSIRTCIKSIHKISISSDSQSVISMHGTELAIITEIDAPIGTPLILDLIEVHSSVINRIFGQNSNTGIHGSGIVNCLFNSIYLNNYETGIDGNNYSYCLFNNVSVNASNRGITMSDSTECVFSACTIRGADKSIEFIASSYMLVNGSAYNTIDYTGEGNVADPTMNNQII